ncbi:hypothetical protein [Halosegnis longus]|uniref:hypothetical protein n=1 Tax=Halosegnis longus TaxID=2216012 RepID=UPI00117CE170|nr:hypothetical protein [Salella cibi]
MAAQDKSGFEKAESPQMVTTSMTMLSGLNVPMRVSRFRASFSTELPRRVTTIRRWTNSVAPTITPKMKARS